MWGTGDTLRANLLEWFVRSHRGSGGAWKKKGHQGREVASRKGKRLRGNKEDRRFVKGASKCEPKGSDTEPRVKAAMGGVW